MKTFREVDNYLILDTETTGLYQGSEICQIGIIDSTGKVLLDTLVRPVNPIPRDAMRIHGITNDQVKDAPTWASLATSVKVLLNDRDVIVYNAPYDRNMLYWASEVSRLVNIEWSDVCKWYCAMETYAEYNGVWNDYYGNWRWVKLSEAARACRVPVVGAHGAVGDCQMTLGIIRYLLSDPKWLTLPTEGEL